MYYNYRFSTPQNGWGVLCGVEIHPTEGATLRMRHSELDKFVATGLLVRYEFDSGQAPPPPPSPPSATVSESSSNEDQGVDLLGVLSGSVKVDSELIPSGSSRRKRA